MYYLHPSIQISAHIGQNIHITILRDGLQNTLHPLHWLHFHYTKSLIKKNTKMAGNPMDYPP